MTRMGRKFKNVEMVKCGQGQYLEQICEITTMDGANYSTETVRVDGTSFKWDNMRNVDQQEKINVQLHRDTCSIMESDDGTLSVLLC